MFFFSSRRRHTRWNCDWSSDVCSSDLFRLATSPSRSFLNTTFNETPSSQAREGRASVMIHPLDAASLGIAEGDAVTLGKIGRARVGKECRSRWSPYHSKKKKNKEQRRC